MKSGCDYAGPVAEHSLLKSPSVCDGLGDSHPVRLLAETLVVLILAVASVRWLCVQQVMTRQWLLIPAVLALLAVVPSWLGGRDFPPIGLNASSIRRTLIVVGWVCVCTLPAAMAGLWLLHRMHLPIPLAPVIRDRSDWLAWLLYQFLYVAIAEEVFFRGYIQNNAARLCRSTRWRPAVQAFVVIVVSAGCFAVAHAVVQERILSLLTFFPGLLMAWLFIRTGSLSASILFHGLANTAFGLAATLLS